MDAENSYGREDAYDRDMLYTRFERGYQSFTDLELLKAYFEPDLDSHAQDDIWKKHLSNNLAAYAGISKLIEERDSSRQADATTTK